MEPLKLIYDGYEIEISSGGINATPVIKMRKMVTNTIEDDAIKLPRTIEYERTVPPAWWESPPMWWTEPNWRNTYTTCDTKTSAEWTNKDSLQKSEATSGEGVFVNESVE